jgi:hypothetical protein
MATNMNQPDEEEAQEDLYRMVMRTDHACACCGDTILFSDESVVITVVVPTIGPDATLVFEPVLADDGDYFYEPRFLEFGCWENVVNEVCEELQDTPPIVDHESVTSCKICESGIRLGEIMGLATKGELLCSSRLPDGVETTTFDAQDPAPDVICIVCLQNLSANVIDLWESIEQGNECPEGTEIRCWRLGCSGKDGCIVRNR